MYILWLIFLMFCSVLAEVLLGNCGLALPVTLLSGFYFAVVMPWRKAFFPLMAAALMMECFRLHFLPVYILAMAVILFMGNLAKNSGDPGSLAFRPLAGLSVCLLWLLLLGADFLQQGCSFGWRAIGYAFLQMLLQPMIFLFLQLFFDLQAEFLHFRKWSEVSRHNLQNLDKEAAE